MRKERPARGRRGSGPAEREDGECFADASRASISGTAADTWFGLANLYVCRSVAISKPNGSSNLSRMMDLKLQGKAIKQSSCSLCLLNRRQLPCSRAQILAWP